jgi:hypothetical protein
MNVLPREKQIAVIFALAEGCSIRATERLTGIRRDTIMRLDVRIGDGCAALHDEIVQGNRLELDELWSYVGKKPSRRCEFVRGALQSVPRARKLRITPATAMGITDHIWMIGELIDAATGEPMEQQAA